MPRIIVSVTSDLVTDQRVRKVCDTLHSEGFEILLVGRRLSQSLPIQRSYKTYRMHLFFTKGFAFYAEYNIRLFLKLFFVRKDILLSNDLDTLLPNYLISKLFQKKLVYDSHELFTEVPELIHRPRIQNVWLRIERFIFPKLKNVYTVCDSIAAYYNEKYKVSINVIRNLPLKKENSIVAELPFNLDDNKLILYQGAINKARGLELLIETMPLLKNCFLLIVGEGDVKKALQERTKELFLTKKVIFMQRQSPEDLAKITPLASVGVSIEEDIGLNYHYALPNKIFDYIQAKIPILVSDLPEMKKIVETYNVGDVLNDRTPAGLAKALSKIIDQDNNSWDFETAINQLNWEDESQKLIEIYKNLK